MALSVVFLLGMAIVREWMEERLAGEGVVTVIVRRDDIQWQRPGREAIIEGRLFDVASQTDEGGLLRLQGIFDDGETWLLDLLARSGGRGRGVEGTLLQRILLPCLGLVWESAPGPHDMACQPDPTVRSYSMHPRCRVSAGHPASVFQPPPFSCRCYC